MLKIVTKNQNNRHGKQRNQMQWIRGGRIVAKSEQRSIDKPFTHTEIEQFVNSSMTALSKSRVEELESYLL